MNRAALTTPVSLTPASWAQALYRTTAIAVLALSTPAGAWSACWEDAAQRHGVSAQLLFAIAQVESGLDPHAVNRSHQARTASYDIGLMQINSRHLPRLSTFGLREADLHDACTNLLVGAWLLADIFSRKGLSWDAVGSYNAACSQLRGEACNRARATYAWKVYRHLPTSAPDSERSHPAPADTGAAWSTPVLTHHVRVAP